MAKKKVEFPFIKVYDLKGLNAEQKLFLCRVWNFQSKNMKCYITNNTWADYLPKFRFNFIHYKTAS
jgi:hypothetical protein